MHIVIIGNGFAGVNALETIRAQADAAEVQISMISREKRGFYSPASLFAFVEGRVDEKHMILRDEAFYQQLGVETYFGRPVVGVDPPARQVILANGERLTYDRLLIASGSSARKWDFPGTEAKGVFKLDWLDDAYALMAHTKRRVVVVGAGRLGVELAAVLQEGGAQVTLLEKMSSVLPGVFDLDMAALIEERLVSHGVDVRLEEPILEIVGDPVTGVITRQGEIPCDTVVLSLGRRPNVDFIDPGLIPLGEAGGVLVDEHLEAVEGVYAAGDCAEPNDFLGRRAVNGVIPTAVEMGRLAGLNMLGRPVSYGGSMNANVLIVFGRAYFSLGALQGERFKQRMGDIFETYVLQDGRLVGAQFAGETPSAAQALQAIRRGLRWEQLFTPDLLRRRLFYPARMPSPPR
jgi:nitrite reductase (NADH) large subunit